MTKKTLFDKILVTNFRVNKKFYKKIIKKLIFLKKFFFSAKKFDFSQKSIFHQKFYFSAKNQFSKNKKSIIHIFYEH